MSDRGETRVEPDGTVLFRAPDGTITEIKGKQKPPAEDAASSDGPTLTDVVIGTAKKQPAAEEAPGPVETFVRKASSAVSSNLVNPLSAKISSAISGQPYDEALRGINETDEAGSAENPKASMAGTATGIGLQLAAPLPLPKGTSALGRAGAGAAAGAGFGAVQGAGDALSEGGGAMDALGGAAKGAALGGAAGGALGAVVPKVEGVLRGAASRVVKRAADDLGVGAGKVARRGLEAKADEIGEALAERPALRKAAETHAKTGDGKALLAEAGKLANDGTKAVDAIYAEAAKPGYRPTNYLAPPPEAGVIAKIEPGGVPLANVRTRLDERIEKLRAGNQVENDVADNLESLRDKLHKRLGEDGAVDPKKLRHEQSGYQKMGKYGKLSAADSVVAQANQEASEAVGDALLEHVTGMPYAQAVKAAEADPASVAAKLLKANGQITAAMRIEQAVEGRAGSNPGAPHRLTHIAHSLGHGMAGLSAIGATGLGHGGVGAAIAAADIARTAAPHVARRLDPVIAKIIQQGTAERWPAARLASAISKASASATAEAGQ